MTLAVMGRTIVDDRYNRITTPWELSTLLPLDDVWLEEIDRRSRELNTGTVQTVPWSEVRKRARERAGLNG
jgi:hypothetical protein